MLNTMCNKCVRLGIDCQGTENQLWSGCIYQETDPRKALKRTLAELEVLEKAGNEAEAAYNADFMSLEKEAAFDDAYKAEWDKAEEAVKLVVKMTRGKIDEKTVRAMLNGKREEIKKLLA